MLGWLRRTPRSVPDLADADWHEACADVRLVHGLDDAQRVRLRALAARFLHDKDIVGAQGLVLEPGARLRLALLACLPVVELGYDWLRGWHQVIVYPGAFRVRRHWHDEDSGVASEADDWLAGESWQHGPLILSAEDVREDLDDPHAGCNLVAHEIAHKIDMRDGDSDGVPLLPAPARRRWIATFQQAFDAFRAEVDGGRETVLDPYAAEAPDEFFAVASETYFSAPDLLAQAHPAVHAELKAFYRVELTVPSA